MNAEDIARALGNAKKSGAGWTCLCPGHSDKNPSLSLSDASDGKVLWKCHAGCEQETVADALKARGLIGNGNGKAHRSPFHLREWGEPSATWSYRYADGKLAFAVARYDTPSGKQLRPWRPKGADFECKGIPAPRPLYRLPELLADKSKPVLVVEGEKCADAAARLLKGFTATTWPNGAKATRDVDLGPLRRRKVTIWPDGDEPGRKAAAELAERLRSTARDLHILEIGDRPEGWDIADAIAEGWTESDLETFIEEHARRIEQTEGEDPDRADLLRFGFWVTEAKLRTDLPYVVKGLFGKGHIIVFWAAPGAGKSFVTLEMACAIGTGQRWRGRRTRKGIVIYVAAESSRPYIENRIMALKQQWPEVAEAKVLMLPLALDLLHAETGDVDRVIATAKRLAQESGEVALIVLDTLAVTFGGGNENDSADMGRYVTNVQRIRTETGAAVLIIHHCGKDEARGMRGHTALLGALDAELAIEGTEGKERILRTGKVRDGDGYTDLLAFTLRPVDLGTDADGEPVRSCVVEGLGQEDLARARRSTKGYGRSQRNIVSALEQHGAMIRPELVKVLADDYGMSKSAAQHAITGLLTRNGIRNLNGLLSLE